MPEVKWVETGFLLDNTDKLRYAGARQRGMVPVLTLDQIEAWLKNNRRTLSQCASVAHTKWVNEVIDDLIAQVQAMKHKETRDE